jgi:hypothetical protein
MVVLGVLVTELDEVFWLFVLVVWLQNLMECFG